VGTPPLGSLGIIELGENLAQILGAQYFAGKILRTLGLEDRQARDFFGPKSENIDFKELK
jgi:hypothetical protein